MAEYIDREKLIPDRCYHEPYGYEAVSCEQISHEEVADVISRDEYEKLKKENVKLRSNIDKAIEKIVFLRQHKTEYVTESHKICIDSGEVLRILQDCTEE